MGGKGVWGRVLTREKPVTHRGDTHVPTGWGRQGAPGHSCLGGLPGAKTAGAWVLDVQPPELQECLLPVSCLSGSEAAGWGRSRACPGAGPGVMVEEMERAGAAVGVAGRARPAATRSREGHWELQRVWPRSGNGFTAERTPGAEHGRAPVSDMDVNVCSPGVSTRHFYSPRPA